MKLIKTFLEDDEKVRTFSTFVELMDEISYSWDDHNRMYKDPTGVFIINKLYIGKNWINYKTEYYKLSPGVYEQVEKFYELLEKK